MPAETYAKELAAEAGQPLDVWRTSAGGDDSGEAAAESGGSAARRQKILVQIEERTSTGTLFGAGTVAIVRQPGPLIRESAVARAAPQIHRPDRAGQCASRSST